MLLGKKKYAARGIVRALNEIAKVWSGRLKYYNIVCFERMVDYESGSDWRIGITDEIDVAVEMMLREIGEDPGYKRYKRLKSLREEDDPDLDYDDGITFFIKRGSKTEYSRYFIERYELNDLQKVR